MIRVKKGGHAHILYKSEAAKFLSEDCDLALIGESVSVAQEHISFGILKGSPLKNDIDKVYVQELYNHICIFCSMLNMEETTSLIVVTQLSTINHQFTFSNIRIYKRLSLVGYLITQRTDQINIRTH